MFLVRTKTWDAHSGNPSHHSLCLTSFFSAPDQGESGRRASTVLYDWVSMGGTTAGPFDGARVHRWVGAPPLSGILVAPYGSCCRRRSMAATEYFSHMICDHSRRLRHQLCAWWWIGDGIPQGAPSRCRFAANQWRPTVAISEKLFPEHRVTDSVWRRGENPTPFKLWVRVLILIPFTWFSFNLHRSLSPPS
jgi:hypothetical protein